MIFAGVTGCPEATCSQITVACNNAHFYGPLRLTG